MFFVRTLIRTVPIAVLTVTSNIQHWVLVIMKSRMNKLAVCCSNSVVLKVLFMSMSASYNSVETYSNSWKKSLVYQREVSQNCFGSVLFTKV